MIFFFFFVHPLHVCLCMLFMLYVYKQNHIASRVLSLILLLIASRSVLVIYTTLRPQIM